MNQITVVDLYLYFYMQLIMFVPFKNSSMEIHHLAVQEMSVLLPILPFFYSLLDVEMKLFLARFLIFISVRTVINY